LILDGAAVTQKTACGFSDEKQRSLSEIRPED
jgi:hypothetical protein